MYVCICSYYACVLTRMRTCCNMDSLLIVVLDCTRDCIA